MPWRPRASCLTVGCQEPATYAGRCRQHAQERERARGTATERGYTQAAWRKRRMVILQQEPLCRMCLESGRLTPATDVDHIVPRAKGGTDDDGNLQPLCKACHSRKTQRGQ